jgi:XTP/dITP diphosphohydrolase
MDLWFVTSNPGKIREAEAAFAPLGWRVRPVRRVLPEPQSDTLEEVVAVKLAALAPKPTVQLVEDSGIFLDALAGFPGVYSAYAYRTLGLDGLLRLLRGRPRAATFRTVAGLRRGRSTWTFVGEAQGRIAVRPRGRHGFGFDPVFVPTRQRRTFAELPITEKLAISHRGQAFRAVAQFLERNQTERARPRTGAGRG